MDKGGVTWMTFVYIMPTKSAGYGRSLQGLVSPEHANC